MSTDSVPVELVGVRIELPTNTPIVLLREMDGDRFLPIWIGATEAAAIALAMEGVQPQRPMTHDLLRDVTAALDATVDRIVLTDLRDGIYFADIILISNGAQTVVSARPSDSIALAVRTSSPIFVNPAILDEAGVEIRDEDEEEEVARFRSFLADVTPEDFEQS